MNKRLFPLLLSVGLILILGSCNNADKTQMLMGDWIIQETSIKNLDQYLQQYKEKYKPSEEDLSSIKMRLESISELYYPAGIIMSFKADSVFELGGTPGTWSYDPQSNTLSIHFSSIDNAKFKITDLSKKKMVLQYESQMEEIPFVIELKLKKSEEKE